MTKGEKRATYIKLELAFHDHAEHIIVRIGVERRVTAKKYKQYDPGGPYVYTNAILVCLRQNLRRNIAGRSTHLILVIPVAFHRETKVRNLKLRVVYLADG